MSEKLEIILVSIFAVFFLALITAFIFIMIDFKNDYDCATTTDPEWYVEHNCMRYER